MPINGPTLEGPLAIFNGLTAYGTSAKGGTRAAYNAVCRDVFGGPMNMRRAFSGLPEPEDALTLWSSKQWSEAAMVDGGEAFRAYGRPALFTHHHEMIGENEDGTPEVSPADYRKRNAAWRTFLPDTVATGSIIMRQDAAEGGRAKEFIGQTAPPWLQWIGFDTYVLDVVGGRTPDQVFKPCAELAAHYGVPWGLAEFNLAGPADARNEYLDECIRWWCNNRHMIFALNFQSNVGKADRVPVNYDGSKEWAAHKAKDRANPEVAEKWRSLAHLTRTQAAAAGNPVQW